MPRWIKSSPALIARFEAALPVDPRIRPRKMFGYPAAFVAEGFFVGLHQEQVVVRLPDDVHAQTKALATAPAFDPMGGRPMKGWYVIPESISGNTKKLSALLSELLGKIANHPEQPSAEKRTASTKGKPSPRPSPPRGRGRK